MDRTRMSKVARRTGTYSRGGRPKNAELEQREEHILEVAGETFLRHGFDGTSMDAVAEAAQISKRTLYIRYADKAALFNAVLSDLINRWLGHIDQIRLEEGELQQTLAVLARHLTTSALTPQSVAVNRVIIAESERRPRFGQLANVTGREPAIRAIASILRRHKDKLRVIDFEIAADQFISLAVDRSLRLAYLGIKPRPAEIEQWVAAAVDLFLNGATRHDAPATPSGSTRDHKVARER
jgi:TetR/AcrR family transcriptional regulator, mexJK operon transcriptional repressor